MQNCAHEILTNKEVEFIHNSLIESWRDAGYLRLDDPLIRAAVILGFARSIEYAVIERVAPELVGEPH
jgi:hypothetical protein